MRVSGSCSPLLRIALVAATSLAAGLAHGAAQRTFVASYGDDVHTASNCSLASPCRSFNAAIGVTNPGGELVILDTAGYGTMTITKSLKVIGPSGVYGGISVLGAGGGITTGIVVNAGATDVVTLRGLDVNGVPSIAPVPRYGIDIQSAQAVHIEKSSVGNFTDPAGACINAAPTAPVIVYVDDSMLRECRTGINANGTAESASGDLAVLVDNTRIELSRATSGPAYGLWVQGNAAATMRSSVVSISDVGIQFNNIATNGGPILVLSQTQVIGGTTCLNVDSSAAGGVPGVFIDGSQFLGCDDGLVFSHTAAGTAFGAQLKITDSKFQLLNNGGITLSTGADAAIGFDLLRSQVSFVGTTAISLAAGGTSGIGFHMRDSTLTNAASALLRTAGTSSISATLIRSNLHNSITAVDHGRGRIRMEQTNVNSTLNSLVNNGSGNIVSAGNNWIVDNQDTTPGVTYITPTVIPMK